MSVELKNSLPEYYTSLYEVGCVLSAVEKELERLYGVINAAFVNLSAAKGTGALELWERDLSLPSYGTAEERRHTILARLGLMRTQTTETIMSIIKAYAAHSDVVITENGSDIAINISEDGEYTPFNQLIHQLDRALPYHLTADVTINSHLETAFTKRKLSVCEMHFEIETGE